MHADIDDIEPGVAAGHLHSDLRPLLLFGDLLETDLDAGQLLEFLLVLLYRGPTRRKLEVDLDLGALGLFPVEGGLRIGAFDDGGSGKQTGGCGQQVTAAYHDSLPWCALRRMAGD